MASRTIYRMLYNAYDDGLQHFAKITPDGLVLSIAFDPDDEYGDDVQVYKTNRRNRISIEPIVKNWFAASKAEWEKAYKYALSILKGNPLPKPAEDPK